MKKNVSNGDGKRLPRFLVIGAGSRGNSYAAAVSASKAGIIAAVAEPNKFKRESFGKKYISKWREEGWQEEQEFDSWTEFIYYESTRREKERAGERVLAGIDGVFVCTLDQTHVEIITSIAPLGLHIMSEKPLATNLEDCIRIYRALKPPGTGEPTTVFSIGHVLRYSPHNMLLRKLLLEDDAIGDILSIEHTEPVGYWHFAHSYVRGNWRKESTSAPSLLTKSCHDIDLIMWLLGTPISAGDAPHVPSLVTSTGSLSHFKRSRKPKAAEQTTNCMSCPIQDSCIYSAKKIYIDDHLLSRQNVGWPVKIVVPELEDFRGTNGQEGARIMLEAALSTDYDDTMHQKYIDDRSWFGRCVYESDNDVCDDQVVTITWDEDLLQTDEDSKDKSQRRGAKTASIHMVAFTEALCVRRGRAYGTRGEIEYDGARIRVFNFESRNGETYYPEQPGGGHGGGDFGLSRQFVKAVQAVLNGEESVGKAQVNHVGCTLEDAIRSHAMVFAAEEARTGRKVVDWKSWWKKNVADKMN